MGTTQGINIKKEDRDTYEKIEQNFVDNDSLVVLLTCLYASNGMGFILVSNWKSDAFTTSSQPLSL